MKKFLSISFILAIFLLLASCGNDDEKADVTSTTDPPADQKTSSPFVRNSDGKIVVGKSATPIFLRGVNLSYDRVVDTSPPYDWKTCDDTDWGDPMTVWYQKKHFKQIADIGFNVVRLNLCYRIFEDNADPGNYKQSGWDLMDQLISWAKTYDIYLIVDMHIAPGGAGTISCLGCGWKTWDQTAYQTRFVNLWKAIAARYKDETQIAAFDLLNEPAPTQEAAQWQTLAQKLIDGIRTVDDNHLIIVEMVNWVFDKDDQSPLSNYDETVLGQFQFLVQDDNVMYDYHYYLPSAYTLQDELGVDGGGYPDTSVNETAIDGSSMPRDKTYLEHEMDAVLSFWQTSGEVANFGEWGTANSAIVDEANKGGVTYVKDMLDLMDKKGVHWQFYYLNHIYQIDCCYDDNPTTPVSQEIVDAFTSYFAAQ